MSLKNSGKKDHNPAISLQYGEKGFHPEGYFGDLTLVDLEYHDQC